MINVKVDLIFKAKPNNKQPINLIFGDDGAPPVEAKNEISAVIPLLPFSFAGAIDVYYPREVTAAIPLHDFAFSAVVAVDYGINENLTCINLKSPFLKAELVFNSYQISFDKSAKLANHNDVLYKDSIKLHWLYNTSWGMISKFAAVSFGSWRTATPLRAEFSRVTWLRTTKQNAGGEALWNDAIFSYRGGATRWGDGSAIERPTQNIVFNTALHGSTPNVFIFWGKSAAMDRPFRMVWNFPQLPGGCGPSIRPPVDPPTIPDSGNITIVKNLIFCKKPNNKNLINLIFGDECGPPNNDYSIPEKGVYIVKNDVEIFRTDDGRIIKAFNVDIGSNSKEYLWSGTMSLPFSELEKVADKPEIEININQLKFIVDVNDIDTKKGFNSGTVDIAVSSTTNRLKTIKSHDLGYDTTSIAIMSAQLHRDGLVTGFVFVNKDGEDWMIQSGLVDYSDTTALDVINSIALSVGDVVISHAHSKEIMMKAKYPTGQPVYSVPIGKLFDWSTNESESIKYNAVVATGENEGITAVVRKDGTAGDKIAPMIVNKLITAENAARRAAINNIYNTDDYSIDISTESVLFKEVPMLYPRDIVQVGNDVGWIEDIRISVALDDKALTVRHLMSIEKKVV